MPKMISMGSQGPDVVTCQGGLNTVIPKAPLLAVDGKFGPKTLQRVKEFQTKNALVADGIFGPKSWAKLEASLAAAMSQSSNLAKVTPVCCGGEASLLAQSIALGRHYDAFASLLGLGNTASSPAAAARSPRSGTLNFGTPATAGAGAASTIAGFTGVRKVSLAEKAVLIAVFGSSIDFDKVVMTSMTGAGGRAFVLTIGSASPGGPAINIVNAGASPTNKTLVHEFTHVWQSQHSSNPTQYMVSAIACQALEATTNAGLSVPICSAYAYVPGKKFGEYNVEQIAQMVCKGEAAIAAHCKAAAKNKLDLGAMAIERNVTIEYFSSPGVKI
jgi:uncharacterized radical SAM superfamily Fe-S cluster-containing enzyme